MYFHVVFCHNFSFVLLRLHLPAPLPPRPKDIGAGPSTNPWARGGGGGFHENSKTFLKWKCKCPTIWFPISYVFLEENVHSQTGCQNCAKLRCPPVIAKYLILNAFPAITFGPGAWGLGTNIKRSCGNEAPDPANDLLHGEYPPLSKSLAGSGAPYNYKGD